MHLQISKSPSKVELVRNVFLLLIAILLVTITLIYSGNNNWIQFSPVSDHHDKVSDISHLKHDYLQLRMSVNTKEMVYQN